MNQPEEMDIDIADDYPMNKHKSNDKDDLRDKKYVKRKLDTAIVYENNKSVSNKKSKIDMFRPVLSPKISKKRKFSDIKDVELGVDEKNEHNSNVKKLKTNI